MKIIINQKKPSSAFNSNYIEYESKENNDKILSIKEYLDMIKPHLSNIISNHKTQAEWKIYSVNTVTDYKTQGEWKFN